MKYQLRWGFEQLSSSCQCFYMRPVKLCCADTIKNISFSIKHVCNHSPEQWNFWAYLFVHLFNIICHIVCGRDA